MKEHFRIKETIVTIISDELSYIETAKKAIGLHRTQLESYILSDPFFRITLDPYIGTSGTPGVPEIVKRLVNAGNTMGIGPMGAVAGTVAALAVEAMVDAGASYAIVDNGGDIAVINDRPIVIGIYAGRSPIKDLAFAIEPGHSITGVCTSAGTVGPSISFGMADAAIVFSDDVSLADSAATALGNAVGAGRESIENAFDVVKDISGIKGAVVIQGKYMGMWGDVPQITRADIRYECITKA